MGRLNTTGNPLSAGSLVTFMASSLPRDATPQLKNPFDAIALAVHAGMLAVGFRLIGLGEDHRIKASEANDPQSLPLEWNSTSSYAFRYAHSQSSMEYLVKVNRLGGKAVVFGIALGDDKTANFDVNVNDFISESSLPSTPLSSNGSIEDTSKTLQDIFISAGRITDLGTLLKINIIQKLAPGLYKEGYEDTKMQAGSSDTREGGQQLSPPPREPDRPEYNPLDRDPQPEPARPYPFNDPLAARPDPRRPLPEPMPRFEDEYEINRPPRGFGTGGWNPLNIGEDDLYPPGLGPHDPLRSYFGGGLPRPRGGGGMHPTFDDPLLGRQGQGGAYDPAAPPGSRFDPVGPGGAPRGGRMGPRFPGGGGSGMGGRPPNPFGGFGDDAFI